MKAVILKAKNGSDTCTVAGRFLHSAYNPEREAAQYVAKLTVDFVPRCILIIEPGLSYCAIALRDRFPQARLCCIRLTTDFSSYDVLWDTVFYASGAPQKDAEALYNSIGEESLCALFAAAWAPSEQVFASEVQTAWLSIKQAVLKGRDVLYTRAYFAKRWLKNTVRFAQQLTHPALLQRAQCPIVIAASGTSLATSLPKLAEYRRHFFLIAASSALLPLLHAGIQPDIVISTDGGYWAKEHLRALAAHKEIALALAVEGASPAQLLQAHTIIPLVYQDSIAVPLLTASNIPFMYAARNGTVSGTALQLAAAITTGDIFICGLDLAASVGFQHTQPNALEARACSFDMRLHTKETRAAIAQYTSGSLAVYRDWFIAHAAAFKTRVFRLSNGFQYECKLGELQDVDWQFFSKRLSASKQVFPTVSSEPNAMSRQALAKTLQQELSSGTWDSELLPLESVLLRRTKNQTEAESLRATMQQARDALITTLCAGGDNG